MFLRAFAVLLPLLVARATQNRRCASGPMCGSGANRFTSRGELGSLDPAVLQLVEYRRRARFFALRNQAIDGMVISLDELFGPPRWVATADHPRRGRIPRGDCGCRSSWHADYARPKGKSVAVESGALGAFGEPGVALNGMRASDVNVVHLESNSNQGRSKRSRSMAPSR